jgi:hypothetical protein
MKLECSGIPIIIELARAQGFKIFESQDWDLNIIGERNPAGAVDEFDDWLHVCYKDQGVWIWHAFKCTTDAGRHWLQNHNTAILCHNRQYRGAYMIGLHRGKYEALVQRGAAVSVWRDRNGDDVHDYGQNEESGYFGINIHRATARAGGKSSRVDKWSAGCQVIAANDDFNEFMDICRKASNIWGNSFTYTLIESADIS